MSYHLQQKMRGWLAIRPDGENDKFFTDHAAALQYIDEKNSSLEIERRFLVKGPVPEECAVEGHLIHQMYLPQTEGSSSVIRIRKMTGEQTQHFLTVKEEISPGFNVEHELEIPQAVYSALSDLAVTQISKMRWHIPHGDLTIHLDRFYKSNDSLWIAEVELPTLSHPFEIPEWFGEEITGQRNYSNFALAQEIKR